MSELRRGLKITGIDYLALMIHKTAAEHGFWPETGRNLGEMLMLVNTELAECLEENRNNKPRVYFRCPPEKGGCGHITHDEKKYWDSVEHGGHTCNTGVWCANVLKPEGELVEVADAIIRLFDTGHDMASKTRYTLSEVMVMKMAYNETREHMHGKAY